MKFPAYPIAQQRPSAQWARELLDYIRSITLRDGPGYSAKRDSSGTALVIRSDRAQFVPGFSGKVWVGLIRYTGQQGEGYNTDPTKPWVKVVLGENNEMLSISEELGPPSMPVPENEVWFEKANTYGDARVDRVG